MKGVSILYSLLIFSSCILQGFSLPQQRFTGREFARKFGNDADLDGFSENSIQQGLNKDVSPSAKEEGGIVQTVVEIALKFLPALIDALSGSTGPSQTDRIEGIDLNGEDPFSMRNIMFLGLKLFLAIAGGGSNIEKADTSPIQVGVMEAVISTLVGAEDRSEVQVMAKQAVEVINLVITLVEALTTSMSQRAFY